MTGLVARSGATLRQLVADRRLIAEFVRRDIRSRFAGARFGLLWSLFNPAIQLLSYGLIFGFLYGSSDPVRRNVLVASLFCGLFPWWAFQEGTTRGMAALVDQAAVLRRVPIAPVVPITASVLAAFGLQMLGFLMFLLAFAVVGLVTPGPAWFFLPLVMGAALCLALVLALCLAPLYLVVRDTLHIVTAALTVGFFASPVLYELDFLPEVLRPWAELNPMAGILGAIRWLVLAGPVPPAGAWISFAVVVGLAWLLAMALHERLAGRLDEYW